MSNFDEHQKGWIKNGLQDAHDDARARAAKGESRFRDGDHYRAPACLVAQAHRKAASAYRRAYERVDGFEGSEVAVVEGLRRMADEEENGTERWWILAKAAELLEEMA